MDTRAWGTKTPALFNKSATFDVIADGRKLGKFLVESGASDSDFVVVDVSDADAGYYQSIGRDVWWDATNAELPNYTQSVDGIHFVAYPQNSYAFVDTGEAQVPCTAQAQGGEIDVTYDTPDTGRLVVYENTWDGWRASLDGQPVPLLNADWLSIDVPAGEHQISFRYRPWDAWLGLAHTIAGIRGLHLAVAAA